MGLGSGIAGLLLGFLFARWSVRRVPKPVSHAQRADSSSKLRDSGGDRPQELLTKQEAFAERERVSNAMVANFAHDIRTPLTSVRGCLESFLDRGSLRSSAEREALIVQALSGVERTSVLITRLLELSRLEGEPEHTDEQVRLEEIASNSVAQFRASAETKGVRLALNVTPVRAIHGDAVSIERATANIIANAIRYTTSGGVVTVTVRQEPGGTALEVLDTGVGIPPEALPSVGTRFFRVQRDRSRETGGSGLGLAITSQILKNHDSKLEITSSVGKGTLVRFVLQNTPVVKGNAERRNDERPGN